MGLILKQVYHNTVVSLVLEIMSSVLHYDASFKIELTENLLQNAWYGYVWQIWVMELICCKMHGMAMYVRFVIGFTLPWTLTETLLHQIALFNF